MWIGWLFVAAWAVGLSWARWTQSRRVYKALWCVAAMTVFLAGLVL